MFIVIVIQLYMHSFKCHYPVDTNKKVWHKFASLNFFFFFLYWTSFSFTNALFPCDKREKEKKTWKDKSRIHLWNNYFQRNIYSCIALLFRYLNWKGKKILTNLSIFLVYTKNKITFASKAKKYLLEKKLISKIAIISKSIL